MVEPLRHRQSKEAATDMFSLQPPRHISTLPIASLSDVGIVGFTPDSGRMAATSEPTLRARNRLMQCSEFDGDLKGQFSPWTTRRWRLVAGAVA
jgi:hypothetical protein